MNENINDTNNMSDLEIRRGELRMANRIDDLMNEVELYKQAIQDAKDALASAEMELDETLEMEFNQ